MSARDILNEPDEVSMRPVIRWLGQHVVPFMRSSMQAIRVVKGSKAIYTPLEEEVTEDHLTDHVLNKQPIGLYVMDPASDGYTRCAVIDIDDHDKALQFEQLVEEAVNLSVVLESHLLLPWACTSGSGHGIHLWLFWKEPQVSAQVRATLKKIVNDVAPRCHVDIFPAQDRLNGGVGNLVALPLARSSRPINLQTREVDRDLELWNRASPALSINITRQVTANDPIPRLNPGLVVDTYGMADELAGDAGQGLAGEDEMWGAPDPALLQEAMNFIPSTDYSIWLRVGLALKWATSKKLLTQLEAKRLWDEWSKTDDEKYDQSAQDYQWSKFKERDHGVVTLGTVWWLAREGGWKPKKEDLDPQITKEVNSVLEAHGELVPEGSMVEPSSPLGITTGADMAGRMGSSSVPKGYRVEDDKLLADELLWTSRKGGEDEVHHLNERHFVAFDGGKVSVFREDFDEMLMRHKLTRMPLADFRSYYLNRQIVVRQTRQGRPITKPLAELWLESPYRRQYRELVMRPEGAPQHVYNLWRGWTVQPSENGSWDLLKNHILYNLCDGSEELYNYVICWCAQAVQRPETPAGTALVLRGDRGTGKSSFARTIGELFGQHFLHVMSSKAITGSFNAHLRDCCFLFADEAVWAGSKSEESMLKGLVTEPYLAIEGKGRDMVTCRNMVHLIIATNNDWAVPAGMDERRFCVLEVKNHRKQDTQYFRAIQAQLRAGGQARLLHDLLRVDLSRFDVHAIPRTDALITQKLLSLEPSVMWWYEKLKDGVLYDSQNSWDDPARCDLIYGDYVRFCRDAGYRYAGAFEHLSRSLVPLMPTRQLPVAARITVTDMVGDSDGRFFDRKRKVSAWRMPSLHSCRETFEKCLSSGKMAWPEAEEKTKDDQPTMVS